MKQLSIIHLGVGKVGSVVLEQILAREGKIKKDLGVRLKYVAKFNSKNSPDEILSAIEKVKLPFVLIDTTASDQTFEYIARALKRGGYAVLANKKPLSGSQKDFDLLQKLGGNRLFFESTVGAGLPLIRPLKDFLETGDEILEIQGCFSGTLGFLFSELDRGVLFSKAIMQAKEYGYIEPDPRDDLSGMDVARKALILARLMGQKIEVDQVGLSPLYPSTLGSLSPEGFLEKVHTLDNEYAQKVKSAAKNNKVLRFVAKVNHVCEVGLKEMDADGEIGSLYGTDNIFVIKTKRYFKNPLVVKGPGAGIEVTAAGVFSDILAVAKMAKENL